MPGYIDSYYARTLSEPGDRPPLEGAREVETCVIGGGLAGLATALDLAERGPVAGLGQGAGVVAVDVTRHLFRQPDLVYLDLYTA